MTTCFLSHVCWAIVDTTRRVSAIVACSIAFASASSANDAFVELRLDEGAGVIATDTSGRGNNGALLNGPTFVEDTANNSRYSLRLDGSDDYIDLGALNVNGTGLTLAARFKPTGFEEPYRDGRLISKATGMYDNQHVFMLSTIAAGSQTVLRGRVRVGGLTTMLVASGGNITTGVWYHAALTFDGTTIRLYLNGEQVGAKSLSGVVNSSNAILTVGAQPPGAGGKFFRGLVDDVRIYGRGLSASEIAGLIAGSGPNSPSNSQPSAVSDGYTSATDESLSVDSDNGVLANDSDPDSDTLSAVLDDNVDHGKVTLNSDGSFVYQPSPGYAGPDEFFYRADDGAAQSGPARVVLTVEPGGQNSPPMISGAPATSVSVGDEYRFMPTATDSDGDSLTFQIAGRPSWATFNPATGELSGTPGTSDVGTDADIQIGVTDGLGTATLAPFSIEVTPAINHTMTLSWDAPTLKTDGRPLNDLEGYKIHWGNQSGVRTDTVTIDNPGVTTYVIENLGSGTYYFSAKAFDSAGQESDFSNEVFKTFP